MTPDTPKTPREELEARITALLLGELTTEEAAALRQTIAQDAGLAALHDRLKQAIVLVRETVASPEQALLASADAPKLPADRREQLLKSFKIIRPNKLAWHRAVNWREWAALAAMVVGLLAVAGLMMMRSRREVFAGESAGENLFAWFDSGQKSPQRHTVLAGKDASDFVVGDVEAYVKQYSAPTPQVSDGGNRLGLDLLAIAPPTDNSGKAGAPEMKMAGATVASSGNAWGAQKPPTPPQPQALGWNAALGAKQSDRSDAKAEDEFRSGFDPKPSADSTSRRSSRIALPEVAQLDQVSDLEEKVIGGDRVLGGLVAGKQPVDAPSQQPALGFGTGRGSGGGSGVPPRSARPAGGAGLDLDLAVRSKDLAQLYADDSAPAKGLSPATPNDPAGGLPLVAADTRKSENHLTSVNIALGDRSTHEFNESGRGRQLSADVNGDSSFFFKPKTEVFHDHPELVAKDVGGLLPFAPAATPTPNSPPALPLKPASGPATADGSLAGDVIEGFIAGGGVIAHSLAPAAPAPMPLPKPNAVSRPNSPVGFETANSGVSAGGDSPAKKLGKAVEDGVAFGRDGRETPKPDAPAEPELKEKAGAMAATASLTDGSQKKDSAVNRGVDVDFAIVPPNSTAPLRYSYSFGNAPVAMNQEQAPGSAPNPKNLEAQMLSEDSVVALRKDLDGDAPAEAKTKSSGGARTGREAGRAAVERATASPVGGEKNIKGAISGGYGGFGVKPPEPGKVYSVDGVGYANLDAFVRPVAPSDESKSVRSANTAIILPQAPMGEQPVPREPQVQVGAVVINEILFHPPEGKDKPIEDTVKLSNEGKAVTELRGEEKFGLSRGGVDVLKAEYEKQNQAVIKKQAEVDKIKDALKLSDIEASGYGSFNVLEPETLRKLETLRAEAKAEYDAIDPKNTQLTTASKARLESIQTAVDKAKGTDNETAVARRGYFQAKRDLEKEQEVRDKLNQRILSEQVESKIPKTVVEIIDQAEAKPRSKPSFWDRVRGTVTGEVERDVRIAIDKDTPDVPGLLAEARGAHPYDPYFIQTETEKIQSKAVLGKVIEKLLLNESWAKKRGAHGKLSPEETYSLLKRMIVVRPDPKTSLLDIRVKSDNPEEAARIANTIAEVYRDHRLQQRQQLSRGGIAVLNAESEKQKMEIARLQQEVKRREKEVNSEQVDVPLPKLAAGAAVPQPEVTVAGNSFSTFSLNVSDVSFKLAAASLDKGQMPDPATVRSEEFINAFDYRDCEPQGSAPIAFAWERARYPFAHDRDLLRFSIKTAAIGRQAGRPLNLVLLLDNSGSMERADRVRIIQECLRVLAGQLQPQDMVSVVAFARTPRLWIDGLSGSQAGELAQRVGGLTPQGGTNLEDAMNLAYQTARRHFLAQGVNRVVLLTDGAANLGDVEPESLKKKVEANRKQGIALDCFGIGWEGFNDELLELLSRNGDGRYGFVNSPEAATAEFAGQLAGALKVAASDVKVQVEFNPRRTTVYRQIGYAKHQLKKEQFRDNTVDAAEIGAAEAGNALYVVQVNPAGEGPIGTVRVRFKVPGTSDYREHEWPVPYEGAARSLEQSSAALRLAATASAFSEWLVSSPYAAEVTPDRLLAGLSGVPETWAADPRPKKLEGMIRQAKSLAGK